MIVATVAAMLAGFTLRLNTDVGEAASKPTDRRSLWPRMRCGWLLDDTHQSSVTDRPLRPPERRREGRRW